MSDVTFDMMANGFEVHERQCRAVARHLDRYWGYDAGWRSLTLGWEIYSGQKAVTYGDGVANIDISLQIAFHERYGKMPTVGGAAAAGSLRRSRARPRWPLNGFRERPRGRWS